MAPDLPEKRQRRPARASRADSRITVTGAAGPLHAATELLATVGLIAPWANGIVTVLTPIVAVELAVIMTGAAAIHVRLDDARNLAANTVRFVASLFVAIGRLGELG